MENWCFGWSSLSGVQWYCWSRRVMLPTASLLVRTPLALTREPLWSGLGQRVLGRVRGLPAWLAMILACALPPVTDGLLHEKRLAPPDVNREVHISM